MALNTGGGGGSGAGGVRAGLAYVELIAKDKIGPVLDKLHKRLSGIGSALTKAGAVGLGAGAAILAPLTALLNGGIDRAAELKDIAGIFGVTTEAASRMAYAFEVAGGGIEDLTPALAKLAKANTSGKPLDEYLQDVTDSLLGIEDASERFRAAGEIFGDKFAAKYLDVADDLRSLMDEAPLLDAATAANAEKVQQAFNKMGITFKTALLPLLSGLMPIAQWMAQFAQANSGVLITAAAVGAVLVTLGITSIALGAAFNVAAISAAVLKGALILLASTPGLIVLAIAAVVASFVLLTDTGDKMASDLGQVFRELGTTFGETWGGIVAAAKKGDLQAAVEVACAGVKVAWLQMIEVLKREWFAFKNWIADTAKTFAPFGAVGLAMRAGIVPGFGRNHVEEGAESLRRTERELRQARAELSRVIAAAQATPYQAPSGERGRGSIGDPLSPAAMAAVRGTFSGPLGQQLGAGSSWQKNMLTAARGQQAAAEAAVGHLQRVLPIIFS